MKSKLKIKIPSGANEIIHTLQDKGYVDENILGGFLKKENITT